MCGALLFSTFSTFVVLNKSIKVHTLKAPLVLVSDQPANTVHLLPIGTTLYYEKSFPEGFTRYKIYVNVDRMPLDLRYLSDPTEINPLEARALAGEK